MLAAEPARAHRHEIERSPRYRTKALTCSLGMHAFVLHPASHASLNPGIRAESNIGEDS